MPGKCSSHAIFYHNLVETSKKGLQKMCKVFHPNVYKMLTKFRKNDSIWGKELEFERETILIFNPDQGTECRLIKATDILLCKILYLLSLRWQEVKILISLESARNGYFPSKLFGKNEKRTQKNLKNILIIFNVYITTLSKGDCYKGSQWEK